MSFHKVLLPFFILCSVLQPNVCLLNITIVSFGFAGVGEFISASYSWPALDIAVQDANKLYNSSLSIKTVYLDNRNMRNCENVTSSSEVQLSEWYYKNRAENSISALILPGCVSDGTIRHLITNWDMLLISTVATNAYLQDSAKHPTWITTAYISTGAYIDIYVDLLETFQWRSVFIVTDKESPPVYGAVSRFLGPKLVSMGYQTRSTTIFSKQNFTTDQHSKLLTDFSRTSRVFLFFGRGALVRNLLVSAAKMNMTNGEYVYVVMEPFRNKLYGKIDWLNNDTDDSIARDAFRSLLLIQPLDALSPLSNRTRKLSGEILNRSEMVYNTSYVLRDQPYPMIAASYSAVMTFAQVLNNLLLGFPEFDLSRGALIAKEFLRRSFSTRAEDVYFNEDGERRMDMVISHFNVEGSFTPVMLKRKSGEDGFVNLANVSWPSGNWPLPNEPKCGYFGQKCGSEAQIAFWNMVKGVVGGLVGATVLIFGAALYGMRRNLQEKVLQEVWWRIDSSQMTLIPASTLMSTRRHARLSQSLIRQVAEDTKLGTSSNSFPAQYKGALVQLTVVGAIQDYADVSQAFTTTALLDLLKKLRGISHSNVCSFMGITVLPQTMQYAIVAEYAARGSVFELFEACVPMESNFIMSFAVELSQGLAYIHSSSLMYHGYLSSTSCLIDKHFTLKISELAFDKIYPLFSGEKHAHRKKPEGKAEIAGHQKVDILAEGTIIYELFCQRNLPAAKRRASFLQDLIVTTDSFDGLLRRFQPLLKSCYDSNPSNRPTARKMQIEVTKWSNYLYGGSGNLAEKILWRLSQHSEDLEDEVLKRTISLLEERARCDAILARFLPGSVVRQLRTGNTVVPEMFDLVTLMFADMPDFINFVANHSPLRATSVLSELDLLFQSILSQHDVYRVENISDSYMVASGVPKPNGIKNVDEICALAQDLMKRAPERLTMYCELPIKVGIHSGPLAAGVIGTKKPKYCLFGNTVNIASRMCSHGVSGKIQVSRNSAKIILDNYSQLQLEERGWIEIKGAGEMQTFWLMF